MLALSLATSLAAQTPSDQSLGGGAPAKSGVLSRLLFRPGGDGEPGAFVFTDLPAEPVQLAALFSPKATSLRVPGVAGTLRVDLRAPNAFVWKFTGTRLPLPGLFPQLEGRNLVIQGVVADARGIRLTDATAIEFRNDPAKLAAFLEQWRRDNAAGAIESRAREFALEPPDRPLVIAHRGNSGSAPENTVAAIREAFAAGADVVEVDVRLTADGVPVLVHDWNLDRIAGVSGFVEEMTLAEIKGLDVGSAVSTAYAGERVATLSEALAAARGRGRLLLDTKCHGMAGALRDVLRDNGEAVWLWPLRLEFHRDVRGTPILAEHAPATLDDAAFDELISFGVVGFDLAWGSFSQPLVEFAHRHGMLVFTFWIDEPDQMWRALEMGVDGIETGYPGRLVEVRARYLAATESRPTAATISALIAFATLLAAVIVMIYRRR